MISSLNFTPMKCPIKIKYRYWSSLDKPTCAMLSSAIRNVSGVGGISKTRKLLYLAICDCVQFMVYYSNVKAQLISLFKEKIFSVFI